MIIYEITAKVRLDLIKEFEGFMKDVHVQDLLDTGYFEGAEMSKVTDGIYQIQYFVKDRETLKKYLETDAEHLREDFNTQFSEGVTTSREILDIIRTWKTDKSEK